MASLTTNILIKIQKTKYSVIGLIVTISGSAAFLIFQTQYVLRATMALVASISLTIVILARWFTPRIKITCLQDNQFFDIKNQHNSVHPVYNGFAKIEVYADIPDWMDEFEIELDSDGPFKLSEWTPSYVSRSNDTLICKNDIDDLKFTLQVIGEPEKLGNATYNLKFKNGETGRIIHSLKLAAEPELPSIDEEAMTEKEAEEWGVNSSTV